ncbi:hypothetical protein FHR89_001404 [Cellulomonas uda]|nr:hypothetical protein [Cellulomonas uda]
MSVPLWAPTGRITAMTTYLLIVDFQPGDGVPAR